MRVLVTGAAGFIGSHVVDALLADGHAVHALDRTFAAAPPWPEAVRRFEGDVTVPADVAPAVAGCDAVVHLAARVGDWGPDAAYEHVNVDGTRIVLAAAREAGARRFVLVSSVAVHRYRGFRDGDESLPRDSDENAYARSKIAAEDVVRAEAGPLEWTIVRPGVFPYGPRDRTSFAPLAEVLETGWMAVVGGGHAVITTAYVEDLARGLVLATTHPAAAGEVFVLGDDPPIAWRTLLGLFAEALGVRPPRLSVPFPLAWVAATGFEAAWRLVGRTSAPPLTRYRVLVAGRDLGFRSAKAARLLGFAPTVSRAEGIRRTVAWYRASTATR